MMLSTDPGDTSSVMPRSTSESPNDLRKSFTWMIGRTASTNNSPTPFDGQRPCDLLTERQAIANEPLRDLVIAKDICHVYFVNDTEMHALHNFLARMIEEQAARRLVKRASCWQR